MTYFLIQNILKNYKFVKPNLVIIQFTDAIERSKYKVYSSAYKSRYDIIEKSFSCEKKFIIKFTKSITIEETFETASNIVQFGWKKEAIPITHTKKSRIRQFFETIFD